MRTRVVVVLSLVLPVFAGAQLPQVANRVKAGGEGGWDYLTVDTLHHRLYVSRGTHVMVFDTDRDSLIGDIPNTPGVHGVAIALAEGKGFTSNGRDTSVTIFDLATLQATGKVTVSGANPDAIMYDARTHRVFTFNGTGENTTAIDARSGTVVGTIALGGKPEAAVVNANGNVHVNIEDKAEIVTFDPATLQVVSRWSIAPCEDPTGLAIDRKVNRLFVACSNAMMAIVDGATGKVVTTVPTGAGSDGAAYDPSRRTAYTSNGGDGTVTVVRMESPDRFTVAGQVSTMRGARTIILDERTHKLYTASASYGPTPAPTVDRPRPRPPVLPGTFTLLVITP